MSRLKLAKKLQPAKKAWKCFSNKIQSKIHKLNLSKAIKTTLQTLLSAFKSLIHLINSRSRRSLITTSTRTYSTHHHHYHVQSKNVAAIHIDDLFAEKGTSSTHHHHVQGETSREVHGESSGLNTIDDAWKAVVARSPHLQVDQRAEEFISKFHEDMRLQKERSMLEFQEMLARSA